MLIKKMTFAFFLTSFFLSPPAFAEIKIGDQASYDTKSSLIIDGQTNADHALIIDKVTAIDSAGIIDFEETRKTPDATSTQTVSYTEASWLMIDRSSPQTGDEILKQCGTFENSKKITVTLKTGEVAGCEVIDSDDSYRVRIVYAPVPLYIYQIDYHSVDGANTYDLSQQYQE